MQHREIRVSRVGALGSQFVELRIMGAREYGVAVLSHYDITILIHALQDAQKCIIDCEYFDAHFTVPQE